MIISVVISNLWQKITDILKEKQGLPIALSLPEETECSIHELKVKE